jgi:hypothetical protein
LHGIFASVVGIDSGACLLYIRKFQPNQLDKRGLVDVVGILLIHFSARFILAAAKSFFVVFPEVSPAFWMHHLFERL